MHFIQKTFLDATSFYLHYTDYPSEMGLLAEALAQHYDQVIEFLAESPARYFGPVSPAYHHHAPDGRGDPDSERGRDA